MQTPSPQTSGTGYNMVAALVQIMGEDKAFEYLKKLNPNMQTYTQSGTAPSKAAAIGQAAIGIQFTPAFLQLIDEGYPLKLTFPKEGVGFEAPAISIVKGAPHLDAGEEARRLVPDRRRPEHHHRRQDLLLPGEPEGQARQGAPALRPDPDHELRRGPGGPGQEAAGGPLDQRGAPRAEVTALPPRASRESLTESRPRRHPPFPAGQVGGGGQGGSRGRARLSP